jgi:hypothetical protein
MGPQVGILDDRPVPKWRTIRKATHPELHSLIRARYVATANLHTAFIAMDELLTVRRHARICSRVPAHAIFSIETFSARREAQIRLTAN